ncbi:18727_t:CDS:2, partial [Gigaspora margarita]
IYDLWEFCQYFDGSGASSEYVRCSNNKELIGEFEGSFYEVRLWIGLIRESFDKMEMLVAAKSWISCKRIFRKYLSNYGWLRLQIKVVAK